MPQYKAPENFEGLKMEKQNIYALFSKYGVRNIRVFGSFARGEQRSESDVDFLVSPPKEMGLLDFAALEMDLAELLKRKVQLISDRGINPYLAEKILTEAKEL